MIEEGRRGGGGYIKSFLSPTGGSGWGSGEELNLLSQYLNSPLVLDYNSETLVCLLARVLITISYKLSVIACGCVRMLLYEGHLSSWDRISALLLTHGIGFLFYSLHMG